MEQELDEKLELQVAAIEYLDSSGNLQRIRELCNLYNKSQDTKLLIYMFRVDINLLDVFEQSVLLGNLFLFAPAEVSSLFQEIVYGAVRALKLLCEIPSLSQICVLPRITSVPKLAGLNVIQSYRDLSRCQTQCKYVFFRGIIISQTGATKYTQSTHYICSMEDCEGHTGNHFIRVHTPGASEMQIIRDDFHCAFCGEVLIEEKSQRIISEKILCELVQADFFVKEGSLRDQAIPLYVRDDLTSVVELGQQYEGIGIIRTDRRHDKIIKAVEVNSLSKPDYCMEKNIPKSVTDLREDNRQSPWRFHLMLAYVFGAHISPPGTYIKLKLAILLSLLCDVDAQDRPLHILAIGRDTNIIHSLLHYGQQFSSRVYVHSSGQNLTAKVVNDPYIGAKYFIEGGSLLLSRGGICYLGDMSRYKKATRETIQSVLSSDKITIDVASKYTDGLPHTIEIPNQSQIWAYIDPTTQGKSQQCDDVFVGCDAGDISKVLLDSFSILQYTDSGDMTTNEDTAIHAAHQILQDSISTHHPYQKAPISHEEFEQFVKYARKLRPSLTEEADRLIQGYFIASRKARSSNNSSSTVPMLALPTLVSIARSFAKLSLHDTVTENDALLAVKLYEESITARYGYSVLSVFPSPHIPASCVDQFFSNEIETTMQQFHVQLLRFCTKQSSSEE